jgi:hypothetical protein
MTVYLLFEVNYDYYRFDNYLECFSNEVDLYYYIKRINVDSFIVSEYTKDQIKEVEENVKGKTHFWILKTETYSND